MFEPANLRNINSTPCNDERSLNLNLKIKKYKYIESVHNFFLFLMAFSLASSWPQTRICRYGRGVLFNHTVRGYVPKMELAGIEAASSASQA